MIGAAQLLKQHFADRAEIQSLVNSNCFFVVVPQKVTKPWMGYTLREQEWLTKDKVMVYAVTVTAEAKAITGVLAMIPVIRDVMQDPTGLNADYLGSSDVEYVQDATVRVALTFEIQVDVTP